MIKIKKLLKLSPDKIFFLKDSKLSKHLSMRYSGLLTDDGELIVSLNFLLLDAEVFFLIGNTTYYSGQVSLDYNTHYILYKSLVNKNIDINDYLDSMHKHTMNPGRVWKNSKIISFWKNPNSQLELNRIINNLNELYSVNIDKTWYINVKLNYSSIDIARLNSKWIPCSSNVKIVNKVLLKYFDLLLVPIDDFHKVTGIVLYSERLYLNHLKSPLLKIIKKVYQKFRDIPRGMSQALYKDMKTKYYI